MEPLISRRNFVVGASLAGAAWLTPISEILARADDDNPRREPAQSVILLWLGGGPSQLETFDPHPGTAIAGDTRAVDTAVRGIQFADTYPLLAEQMESLAVIRSVMSREGDHERGTYTVKTGHRPDPTVVHPSIGAICAHQLAIAGTEIPRHISIIPNQWPGRGGFLGDPFDAFRTGDPLQRVPDVTSRVSSERDVQRSRDLAVVEGAFAQRRRGRVEATQHQATMNRARAMMTSEQLQAFDVSRESARLRGAYGDTAFGRGCLAARRLIEVGVRCVEVTLSGWDTHADNHEGCRTQAAILDPAFAGLIRDLKERQLLRRTVVICAGEFGRTPTINRLGGRDHWPNGFSVILAGGGLRGGLAIGATDPEGRREPTDPVNIEDIHATVMSALGIEYGRLMQTPIGRTVRFSEGTPIRRLIG
ncbi:MAG TPA: DUF1501 domain-containing protein [Gemmataceae bacterium]|nr:DUF1501 domain-containing protein [Gemmataceae bacterium]